MAVKNEVLNQSFRLTNEFNLSKKIRRETTSGLLK
jgi:hypothetical protein